jgi:hypothetical protein
MRLVFDFSAGVVAGYAADGHAHIQHDGFGEEDSGAQPLALHHWFGFQGVPHHGTRGANGEVDPERSCPLLWGYGQNDGHAWPMADPRWIAKLPQVNPGGSIQYGGKLGQPSFQFFDGSSGSWQVYVPYGFSGTGTDGLPSKAMSIAVNVRTPGAESVEIVHGSGMSVTMLAGGKNSVVVKNAAGDAYVEVNDDGITVNGNMKVNGAVEMANPTAAVPLVLGPQLVAYLEALELALGAAFGAITPAGGGPGIGAAFNAAKLALIPLRATIQANLTKGF